ncbi:MAG: phage major capsid protein [Paracoccaceae bacterium]
MTEEVKTAVDAMATAFEEFKSANDQRLAEIEAKGSADPLTEEKLAKIEGDLDRFENVNQKLVQQQKHAEGFEAKLNEIETLLKRPANMMEAKEVDLSLKAWDNFMRKGESQMDPMELKALTVGTAATAGNLAPAEYVEELLKVITEISPVRSIARVRQTSNKEIEVPSKTASFAAAWTAETGTRSETTGYTTSLNTIPTHEMYALVDISSQLLEDSVFDLEAEMNIEFAEQFAKAEGAAFIAGNGTNKPTGISNGTTVSHTATGAATAAITTDNLMDLVHDLKTDYARNATFLLNRNTLGIIRKLKDTAGQYIFQTGFSGQSGLPNTILGSPYLECPDVADAASAAKSVYYGDFRRGYMIVDRVSLSVLRDPYSQASTGNVRYIARRRVGGEVVLAEAMRVLKHATS